MARPEAEPVSVARAERARALGRWGEEAAAALLQAHGYSILGRGFLARRGEIDLLCRRGDRLLVVEVKTRSSSAYGSPLEAVGVRKRRALLAASAEYRALSGWRGPIDFAVVAVQPGSQPPLIETTFG